MIPGRGTVSSAQLHVIKCYSKKDQNFTNPILHTSEYQTQRLAAGLHSFNDLDTSDEIVKFLIHE